MKNEKVIKAHWSKTLAGGKDQNEAGLIPRRAKRGPDNRRATVAGHFHPAQKIISKKNHSLRDFFH